MSATRSMLVLQVRLLGPVNGFLAWSRIRMASGLSLIDFLRGKRAPRVNMARLRESLETGDHGGEIT